MKLADRALVAPRMLINLLSVSVAYSFPLSDRRTLIDHGAAVGGGRAGVQTECREIAKKLQNPIAETLEPSRALRDSIGVDAVVRASTRAEVQR